MLSVFSDLLQRSLVYRLGMCIGQILLRTKTKPRQLHLQRRLLGSGQVLVPPVSCSLAKLQIFGKSKICPSSLNRDSC